MGTVDSKTSQENKEQEAQSTAAPMNHQDDVVLIRAPGGVRVLQLEGNNFLGRLADAGRFAAAGAGPAASVKRALLQRFTANPSSAAPVSSGSSKGRCSGGRFGSVGFRHGGANSKNSTAASCSSGVNSSRVSSNCGDDDEDGSSSVFHDPARRHNSIGSQQQQPPPVNLTTLLLRGFDPVDYERRWAETRLSRQQYRQQQQQQQQQRLPQQRPFSEI